MGNEKYLEKINKNKKINDANLQAILRKNK